MSDLVLFDATCGICTAFKDFAHERDHAGRLDFQPLYGEAHRARVSEELQAEDPDTVIVVTEGGRELVRAEAIRHLLVALGAPWSWLGRLLGRLPDGLTDRVYRAVAARRKGISAMVHAPT